MFCHHKNISYIANLAPTVIFWALSLVWHLFSFTSTSVDISVFSNILNNSSRNTVSTSKCVHAEGTHIAHWMFDDTGSTWLGCTKKFQTSYWQIYRKSNQLTSLKLFTYGSNARTCSLRYFRYKFAFGTRIWMFAKQYFPWISWSSDRTFKHILKSPYWLMFPFNIPLGIFALASYTKKNLINLVLMNHQKITFQSPKLEIFQRFYKVFRSFTTSSWNIFTRKFYQIRVINNIFYATFNRISFFYFTLTRYIWERQIVTNLKHFLLFLTITEQHQE